MNNKIFFHSSLSTSSHYNSHELSHDPQILSSCSHIENSFFLLLSCSTHLKNKFHCLMRKILCVCLVKKLTLCVCECVRMAENFSLKRCFYG